MLRGDFVAACGSVRLAPFPQKSPLALLIAMTIFHHLGIGKEADLLRSQVLSRGIEMRTSVLRTFPESAAEIVCTNLADSLILFQVIIQIFRKN
tara:strand:+ start:212 stop:493 length:282 start_codon:yes stop_codon:yes gene_type:complete